MGLFDFLKKADTQKDTEEQQAENVESTISFEETEKQEMMEWILNDLKEKDSEGAETGELDIVTLHFARDVLSPSEIRMIVNQFREGSSEKISSVEAQKDKGEVGSEYSKFINSLELYELFLVTYKLPNLCGDDDRSELDGKLSELMEQYGIIKKTYHNVIDSAEAYINHRKGSGMKALLYAMQNSSSSMKNRLEYVKRVKEIATEESEKVSQFINMYIVEPKIVVNKLGYSDDTLSTANDLTWADVIFYSKLGIVISKPASGSDKLGKGQKNVVYKTESNVGSGVMRQTLSEHNDEPVEERKSRSRIATQKSVALAMISRLLGTSIVAASGTAFYAPRSEEVEYMEKAKGTTFKAYYSELKTKSDDEKNSGLFDSRLLKQLSQLHLIDALTFQKDRHAENIFINDKDMTVVGIDNDLAFESDERDPIIGMDPIDQKKIHLSGIRMGHLPPLGKYHDKEMAEKIIALDPQMLKMVVVGLLLPEEIAALIDRLTKLQEYLNSSKVTLIDDWSSFDTNGYDESDDNYLSRLKIFLDSEKE